MRIYIAGPYSNPEPNHVRINVDQAIAAGLEVLKKGHYPFIPHLTHLVREFQLARGLPPLTYEEALDWDFHWLHQCHGLLLLGDSPGVKREVKVAIGLGIVVFNNFGDIPPAEHGYTDFEDHSARMFPDRG